MTTRRNIAPPNLLIAPKDYSFQYQEQLNNAQRLFYNSVANQVNSPMPYGSFTTVADSTGSLTNPVANTVNLVPFSVTTAAYHTKIGAVSTRLYVAETGVYNVQFSAQCDLTAGSNAQIYFWVRQNGADIPATTGKVVVASPNAETMAAWNYIFVLQENDYIELAWGSADTHAFLQAESAFTTGLVRPALPAVILTITWVSLYNISAGAS